MSRKFTGGTVPLKLFTRECFQDLAAALTTDGVVAINWVGDVLSDVTQQVIRTINSVFQTCRIFEDGDAHSGYLNMVLFCTMQSHLRFRQPSTSDLITAVSPRQRVKVLQDLANHELNIEVSSSLAVLTDATDWHHFEKAQREGVRKHWAVMSKTLPPETWAMF